MATDSLTAMSVPKEGPERLIHFVKQRLADLGMTQGQLAERGGPDRSTLGKLRTRHQNTPTVETLRKFDGGLGWEPGSAAVTLLGGTPQEARAIATVGRPLTGQEKLMRLVRQADRRSEKLRALLAAADAEAAHLRRQLAAALGDN